MNGKKQIALFYALAVMLWLVYGLAGCGVMLYHRSNGTMPMRRLSAEELTFESFVNYDDLEWREAPDERPNWWVSTDGDPKIFWEGKAFLETVVLHAEHHRPAGAVVLYYRKPGQTDFSEAQKVFGRCTGAGEYTFALGGVSVNGLRIDPDSVGGVPTIFTGVSLNPVQPWYLRFVPDGRAWLMLLAGPILAAALVRTLQEALKKQQEFD